MTQTHYEEIDRTRAKHLINIFNSLTVGDDQRAELLAFLKKRSLDPTYRVEYKYGKNLSFGRLYAKQMCLQRCPKNIRKFLAQPNYNEIDMKNCHPIILEQLCGYENIDCPHLREYNKNREIILERTGLNKSHFIAMMNGGGVPQLSNHNPFVVSFYKEQQRIANNLYHDDTGSAIKKYILRKKTDNAKGKYMAHRLQHIEAQIMAAVRDEFLKGPKISLIHDAYYVPKDVVVDIERLNEKVFPIDGCEFKVTFKLKPLDDHNIEFSLEDEKRINDYIPFESDSHAYETMKDDLDKIVRYCDDRYFVKLFQKVYVETNKDTFRANIGSLAASYNFMKETKMGLQPYSKNYNGQLNIERVAFREITKCRDKRDNIIQQAYDTSRYKLCYKNGYYDFKKRSFITWEESTEDFVSLTHIDRDWSLASADAIKWVDEKILTPILREDKQRWLHWVARALAGTNEKTWAMAIGNRNCGKGVLTQCLQNAFGHYVRNFIAGELFTTKGDSDETKRNKWLIPLTSARLFVSNECRTENELGKAAKLDGNMIKSIASGGDMLQARLLHQNTVEFQLQGKLMLMMNDAPRVEPEDANTTRCGFQFRVEFKDQLTEGEKRCQNYRYEKADPDIKYTINKPEYVDAFAQIVINAYNDDLTQKDELFDDDELDDNAVEELLNELFEFTAWNKANSNDDIDMDPVDDIMTVADVNKILRDFNKERSNKIKKSSLMNIFARKDCIKKKWESKIHHSDLYKKTVYIGVRVKAQSTSCRL